MGTELKVRCLNISAAHKKSTQARGFFLNPPPRECVRLFGCAGEMLALRAALLFGVGIIRIGHVMRGVSYPVNHGRSSCHCFTTGFSRERAPEFLSEQDFFTEKSIGRMMFRGPACCLVRSAECRHRDRMMSDFKQFYRGIHIDFIFREDQGGSLKGGDRQFFQLAHFTRLCG